MTDPVQPAKAPLRWKRAMVFAVIVGTILFAIAWAPRALQSYDAYRERKAAEPHPVPATDAQQVELLRAMVADYWFDRTLPQSIEPDDSRVPLPVLLDQTYSIEPCGSVEVYPPLECASPVGTGDSKLHFVLTNDPYFLEVPLKLRREMVLANRAASAMPDPGIPGLQMAETAKVRARFASGLSGWRIFRADYPEAVGILTVSRAVLSEDGSQALMYVDQHCGDLCGSGMLVLLRRSGDKWFVAAKIGLWVS